LPALAPRESSLESLESFLIAAKKPDLDAAERALEKPPPVLLFPAHGGNPP
jgi:hypothetical protein